MFPVQLVNLHLPKGFLDHFIILLVCEESVVSHVIQIHGFSSIPPELLKNDLCSLTACAPCRLHVCPGLFLDAVVSFSFLPSFQCKLISCVYTGCQNQLASPSEHRLTFCWIPQTESASSILSNVKCHLVNQIWLLHLLFSIFPD